MANPRKMVFGVDGEEGAPPRIVRAVRQRQQIHFEPWPEDAGLPSDARIAAALPAAASVAHWLGTPFASLGKARKVFPSLLDIQLPFPLESCAYQFLRTRATPDGRVETLAVAARTEHIVRRLDFLRGLGSDPEILDQEGLALWSQAMEEFPVESHTLRVVAFLGRQHTVFALGLGDRFLGAYSTQTGSDALFRGGEGPADPAAIEKWIRRARQVEQAHQAGPESNRQWIWTGPGADRESNRRALEQALRRPDACFLTADQPALFLARALARRLLRPDAWSINLRAGSLAHPRLLRQGGRVRQARAVATLAAGIVLCVLNGAWQFTLNRTDHSLQQQAGALAAEISRLARVPRGQELVVVDRALADRAPLTEPFTRAFEPSLLERLLVITRAAREHNLQVESLNLRSASLSLRGSGEDWNECQSFANQLSEAKLVVHFDPEDAGPDERVHFTIEGKQKP